MLTVIRRLVFEELGFQYEHVPDKPTESSLRPPPIDPDTSDGQAARRKLLRAWVELSAWLAIYGKNNSECVTMSGVSS